MTSFDKVLSDIFDRDADRRFESAQEEREVILKARQGDNDAFVALLYAYGYTLRSQVSRFKEILGREEAISVAMTSVTETIHTAKIDRLAGTIRQRLANDLQMAADQQHGFTIPSRSMKRFFAILKAADGNVFEAARIAPDYAMSRELFLTILSAVRNTASYDGLTTAEGENSWVTDGGQSADGSRDLAAEPLIGPIRSTEQIMEDEILVEAAFAAVDDLERTVCELTYGFTEYDPLPDAEIGRRLGLSRQKTQRTRAGALGKMRKALGVA